MSKILKRLTLTTALSLVFGSAWLSSSEAQLQPITTTTLCTSLATCSTLVPDTTGAILRRPTGNVLGKSQIGIFIMHPHSSYTNNAACSALTQRGYTTLCANSITNGEGSDSYYGFEQHALGIKSGINYLRNNVASPAISKVIIFGHSVGAPMIAFYQNVAENGAAIACQGPEKILPCVDTNLQNLPKADGVILFDSQEGPGVGSLIDTDPAIVVNSCPQVRDPSLDMFSAANGYNAQTNGATFTSTFRKRFYAAQSIRQNDILNTALSLLQQRRIATGNPNDMGDDIILSIVGVQDARPWKADLSLIHYTKKPHILLARDGTRPVQIVETVRVPTADIAAGLDCNTSIRSINVHHWLGARTVRTNGRFTPTENDITGIDWDSTATNSITNVKGIGRHPNGTNPTTPFLIVTNGGYYFIVSNEIVYDNAFSTDKTYAIEEGSVHGGGPCTECAVARGLPPDWYGDTATRTYQFMAEWLAARY